MKKLKIVHIVPFLRNAGAEKLLIDLAYAHKTEHEVTIICLFPKREFSIEDFNIIYLNKQDGLSLKTFWDLYKTLKKMKPDIVHTHLYSALYVFLWHLLSKKHVGIHTVHSMPIMEFGKIHRALQKFAYKHLRVSPVAISATIKEQIMELYSLGFDDVPLIYNGVDVKKFLNPSRNFDGDTFTVINVAAFSKWKNQAMLVDAFHMALEKNQDMRLIFVGDGAEEENIRQKVKEYGIEQKVKFVGVSFDVPGWLSQANVFVLCSVFEGLPLSIIEAKASGLPVIATDVGGIKDIVKDGVNGFLVPSQDAEALKDTLLKLSYDKKLQQKMSFINAEEAMQLDIEEIAKQYMNLYQKKIGEKQKCETKMPTTC